ncbi:hypothetical protein AX14_014103 [Amanita brunnescens Koide BX004]|nr:hypothetical protein AX14_014103 [Amanita brunnescens Koide BX004]
MPIERFLKQRESEDHSDSFSVSSLDLPLPPPTAADFPELPRAAPTPKMTKAEKAMAEKINTLLLSDAKGKRAGVKDTAPNPVPAPTASIRLTPGLETAKAPATVPAAATAPSKPAITPGILPVTGSMRSESPESDRLSQGSGASTPIMAMAAFHAEHVVSCSHDTGSCGVCRVGITCCKCRLLYTAPAAKRMRCTKCLHWACDLDQSIGCCECNTPWVPLTVLSPPVTETNPKPATRFRGGASSGTASISSSTDTSQDDSTVKIKISAPTQESMDEIDALSRPPADKPAKEKGKPKTRCQPKSGQSSREPSRPSSAASDRLSTTETVLPKPDYEVPPLAHEYSWSSPPSDVKDIPGYVYEAHQEKTLHIDDDDVMHFIKRGDVDVNDLSNQLDILLSGTSSWKTIYHAITDLFQFDSIIGTRNDFICLLIGLARSWEDDAECNPAGIVKTLIDDASSLVKTEEELHLAQNALSRIRNERNQAMTDVKKLSETVDRLRKDRNHLKAAMQDIVNSGGVAPTAAQFEELQQEVALLKDEKAGLVKIIEHDKAALRTAEDENTAMTLQISLMNEDIDDKNALIEQCQEDATEMLKKYGEMEILSTSAKHELESAKSVITTMKAQHDAERKVYETRIQRLKAHAPTEPAPPSASHDQDLRKELAIAKERIAFLEKAYKEKSDALKAASSGPQKGKAQQASAKAASSKAQDMPKWGFEPPDEGIQHNSCAAHARLINSRIGDASKAACISSLRAASSRLRPTPVVRNRRHRNKEPPLQD